MEATVVNFLAEREIRRPDAEPVNATWLRARNTRVKLIYNRIVADMRGRGEPVDKAQVDQEIRRILNLPHRRGA